MSFVLALLLYSTMFPVRADMFNGVPLINQTVNIYRPRREGIFSVCIHMDFLFIVIIITLFFSVFFFFSAVRRALRLLSRTKLFLR